MSHGSDERCQSRLMPQNHFANQECRKYHTKGTKKYQALVCYYIPRPVRPEEGGASCLMTNNEKGYRVKLCLCRTKMCLT